jgi:hypothetical protein
VVPPDKVAIFAELKEKKAAPFALAGGSYDLIDQC